MPPVLPILQSNELKVNETITKNTLLSSVRSNNKNKKIKVHLDLFTHPPEEIQSIPNNQINLHLNKSKYLMCLRKHFLNWKGS